MYRTVTDNILLDSSRGTTGSALASSFEVGPLPSKRNNREIPALALILPHLSSDVTRSPPRVSRQLLNVDWEGLKELLHTLYIKENKTLRMVRTILRDNHGLTLSEKQLTRRFAEWEFKKNVKRKETPIYLEATKYSKENVTTVVNDVRITPAKRERWQKRARTKHTAADPQGLPFGQSAAGLESSVFSFSMEGETSVSFPSTPSPNHDRPIERQESSTVSRISSSPTLSPDTVCRSKRHDSLVDPDLRSPKHLSPELTSHVTPSSSILASSFDAEPAVEASQAYMATDQASEVDHSWSLMPAIRQVDPSPLTRLFAALKLNFGMADVALSDGPPQLKIKEPTAAIETVCPKELQELNHKCKGVLWFSEQAAMPIFDFSEAAERPGRTGDIVTHNSTQSIFNRSESTKRTVSDGFKVAGVDVIFPSHEVVLISPLNGELYPFPPHQGTHLKAKSAMTVHGGLLKEVKECLLWIEKLETSALGTSPAVTILIERLASAYFNLGHYQKSEQQIKRILPALEEKHGTHSRRVISSKKLLAKTILYMGRVKEGNHIAQEVYNSARSIDNPGGQLVQQAMDVLALSFGFLRDSSKVEELLTQLVQIRLVSLGPRHGDTLDTLRVLGRFLFEVQRKSGSEELSRVVIELGSTSPGLPDHINCLSHYNLARVLYDQDRYREGEELCRKALEIARRSLGAEHLSTLDCIYLLALLLKKRGLFQESYDLLIESTKTELKIWTELDRRTIDSMAILGTLLVRLCRFEEAEIWMRRALRCGQQSGKVENSHAIRFITRLSQIEEPQRTIERTIRLYDDTARTTLGLLYAVPQPTAEIAESDA